MSCLRALSLRALQQRLIEHEGRYYDAPPVCDANGAQGKVFFEVTAVVGRTLQRHLTTHAMICRLDPDELHN